MTAGSWDTSKLKRVGSGLVLFRAIDDDDIEGWDPAGAGHWKIARAAFASDRFEPSDDSGFGLSTFVRELLVSECNAILGQEVGFLQDHSQKHACKPPWNDGIVAKVRVDEVLQLAFGVGESRQDCACAEIANAHASVWKDASWPPAEMKKRRNALLKLFGQAPAFESSKRRSERLATGAPSVPPKAP